MSGRRSRRLRASNRSHPPERLRPARRPEWSGVPNLSEEIESGMAYQEFLAGCLQSSGNGLAIAQPGPDVIAPQP